MKTKRARATCNTNTHTHTHTMRTMRVSTPVVVVVIMLVTVLLLQVSYLRASSLSPPSDADLLATAATRISLNSVSTDDLLRSTATMWYVAKEEENYSKQQQHHQIGTISHMLVHGEHVYVSAADWLLKLSARTLRVEQSVRYGPVLDSPACRYSMSTLSSQSDSDSSTAGCRLTRTRVHNHNKLLLVYEARHALLSCWSARQGTCELRSLDDLTQLVQNSSVPAVGNDARNSTVGFIAAAANSQELLYVAATYTGHGPYRDEVPALAGRSLDRAKFMSVLGSKAGGLKASRASIEFIARFAKSFIVHYVHAFNHGVYNYFLSVQHADTDAMQRGERLLTKIGRLCLNDLSFTRSYVEMPLRCRASSNGDHSDSDYNELVSARLVRLAAVPYVLGLFARTSRTSFNASSSASPRMEQAAAQAVCLFPLKLVQAKFKDNLRKCYNSADSVESGEVMRGLSFIKPDQRCSSVAASAAAAAAQPQRQHQQEETTANSESEQSAEIGDDFCSSADNGLHPIGGQLAASANALLELHGAAEADVDSVEVSSDQVATSLLLLSSRRSTLSYYRLHVTASGTLAALYRRVPLSPHSEEATSFSSASAPLAPIQLSGANHFVVDAASNSVLKLRSDECSLGPSTPCGACIASVDPYCGWCASLGECGARAQCPNAERKWMRASSSSSVGVANSMCVDMVGVEPSVLVYQAATSVEIAFAKELNGSVSSSDYMCVFAVTASRGSASAKTSATLVNANKLRCSLPSGQFIQAAFDARLAQLDNDNDNDDDEHVSTLVELDDDGLFVRRREHDDMASMQLALHVQSVSSGARYGLVMSSSESESTALFNVTVVDCAQHRSCVSCVSSSSSSSSASCQWCGSRCEPSPPAASVLSTCVTSSSHRRQCASFDTAASTSKLLIPFTAHRPQAPLLLVLDNMMHNGEDGDDDNDNDNESKAESSNSIQCMFTEFNGRREPAHANISVPFVRLNRTHAHCVLSTVFAAAPAPTSESRINSLDRMLNTHGGQVQTNLRLYDSRRRVFIDSLRSAVSTAANLELLFYKCETKARDCTACLSLNRQLSCMWCANQPESSSSCRFMNAQSKLASIAQCLSPLVAFTTTTTSTTSSSMMSAGTSGVNAAATAQCERPQIRSVEPRKLSASGGTLLVVAGLNLASTPAHVAAVHLQCGDKTSVVCDPLSEADSPDSRRYFVSGKQIVCRVRSSPQSQSSSEQQQQQRRLCQVSMRLRVAAASSEMLVVTGSQQVELVEARVTRVQPAVLIQSAKFVWLTLSGTHLDAGRSRRILLVSGGGSEDSQQDDEQYQAGAKRQQQQQQQQVNCEIKNVSRSEIRCRLDASFGSLGTKRLRLLVDGVEQQLQSQQNSVRVIVDPLVTSIDRVVALHAGGTRFRLYGHNLDAVQSAYAYVATLGDSGQWWYSDPLAARYSPLATTATSTSYKSQSHSRHSIEFEFPPLGDSFPLVSAARNHHRLAIGFLLDGFNTTLKDVRVAYVPTAALATRVHLRSLDIRIDQQQTTNSNEFSLLVDIDLDMDMASWSGGLDESKALRQMVRDDLQVFVACVECTQLVWLNETRASCQLPSLTHKQQPQTQQQQQHVVFKCEPKAFAAMLAAVDEAAQQQRSSQLRLVHAFVGNMPVVGSDTTKAPISSTNLDMYVRSYTRHAHVQHALLARALAASTSSTQARHLLDELILSLNESASSASSLNLIDALDATTAHSAASSNWTSKHLLLLSAITSALLVMLVAFVVILASLVAKSKINNNNNNNNNTNNNSNSKGAISLRSSSSERRCRGRIQLLSRIGGVDPTSTSTATTIGSKRQLSKKQQRREHERVEQQLDELQHSVSSACAQLYQQLHVDYMDEVANELAYRASCQPAASPAPLWNYKTYMLNVLLDDIAGSSSSSSSSSPYCSSSSSSSSSSPSPVSELVLANVAGACGGVGEASTMSASCASSVSTTNTLLLTSQQQYATIKSCMLTSGMSGMSGEAMALFDQLLHTKSFLLTFVHVCDREASSGRDKQRLAALLTLALRDNLPYMYTVIRALVSELIATHARQMSTSCSASSKNKNKKNKKKSESSSSSSQSLWTLFRCGADAERASVAELMLANWLAMFMHDTAASPHIAACLYRLNRAVKHYVCDMGACDQQAQRAAHSLAATHVLDDEQLASVVSSGAVTTTIYVNVVVLSARVHVCRLVACDTIAQAKQKIVDAVYSSCHYTASTRPHVRQVELELCLLLLNNNNNNNNNNNQQQQQADNKHEATTTTVLLKETEDELMSLVSLPANASSTQSEGSRVVRLLTLNDYNIQNGSFLNLILKNDSTQQQQQQQQQQQKQQQQQQQQQQQHQQHVYASTLSMNNEYVVYASPSSTDLAAAAAAAANSASQRLPPAPPPPPPPLPTLPPLPASNTVRYHLIRPSPQQLQQLQQQPNLFSSSSASSASSSECQSSTSSAVVVLPNNKKSNKQSTAHENTATSTATTTTTTNATSCSPSLLARLLVNKTVVQPFVDELVDAIFSHSVWSPVSSSNANSATATTGCTASSSSSSSASVSPVLAHLFHFFEVEARKHANTSETSAAQLARAWQTNAYLVAYWLNTLMRRPTRLLDTERNELVDASLDTIVNALVHACDAEPNPSDTSDSSSSSPIDRLLFARDTPRYRQMIDEFFDQMSSCGSSMSQQAHHHHHHHHPHASNTVTSTSSSAVPNNNNSNNACISDHELHFYLNEFAKRQQHQFATQRVASLHQAGTDQHATASNNNNNISALKVLTQLYEYYDRHEQPINSQLGQQQCSVLLPVHHRLVQIKDLMMGGNGTATAGAAGEVVQANQHQQQPLIQHHHSFNVSNMSAGLATSNATMTHSSFLQTLSRPYLQSQHLQHQQQHLSNSSCSPYQQPINCYATTADMLLMSNNHSATMHHLHHHQAQSHQQHQQQQQQFF